MIYTIVLFMLIALFRIQLTLPGLAGAAASALYAMKMSVVLGTLAGDDTVMVVMRDANAAAAFCGEIRSLMN